MRRWLMPILLGLALVFALNTYGRLIQTRAFLQGYKTGFVDALRKDVL